MIARSGLALTTCALLAVAAPAVANPGGPARGLGDPLLPQIGNRGYDVQNYRIYLDYDPAANFFNSAETTIRARALKTMNQFSLDFQALDVSSVKVDGREVRFRQVEATPQLSDNPAVTQPMKLMVDLNPPNRLRKGSNFTVVVTYSGAPEAITDTDESIEGWIRACYPRVGDQTCDGAFVVNEPIGAQSWFPSNNHPSDKATFDTLIRVPEGKTALGVGENVGNIDNGDGTVTWRWREDDPTATYLTTATVGDFTYTDDPMTETSIGRSFPVYNAVDSSATAAQAAAIQVALAKAPVQLNYLSDLYGPYPFDSSGAVADRAAGVGYALEVQGKPHYPGGFNSGNPFIEPDTQLHELAHQWFGNAVTLQTWADIWFNEGWAYWSELYWSYQEQGGDDPADIFYDTYANAPAEDWELAPAVLGGDPANLFAFFPTYERGAMTLQGYREIVGDAKFFALADTLLAKYRYSNISTRQFIAEAKIASGFKGAKLGLLDRYFRQWLYGTTRPTILPGAFA
ncbi:MAG: M1 family metallopeptidase [Candidatus Nanopelagicales bacterium]|nr:M1 family metallopeptidase [Candidatus Nanopelagicales bacterium]